MARYDRMGWMTDPELEEEYRQRFQADRLIQNLQNEAAGQPTSASDGSTMPWRREDDTGQRGWRERAEEFGSFLQHFGGGLADQRPGEGWGPGFSRGIQQGSAALADKRKELKKRSLNQYFRAMEERDPARAHLYRAAQDADPEVLGLLSQMEQRDMMLDINRRNVAGRENVANIVGDWGFRGVGLQTAAGMANAERAARAQERGQDLNLEGRKYVADQDLIGREIVAGLGLKGVMYGADARREVGLGANAEARHATDVNAKVTTDGQIRRQATALATTGMQGEAARDVAGTHAAATVKSAQTRLTGQREGFASNEKIASEGNRTTRMVANTTARSNQKVAKIRNEGQREVTKLREEGALARQKLDIAGAQQLAHVRGGYQTGIAEMDNDTRRYGIDVGESTAIYQTDARSGDVRYSSDQSRAAAEYATTERTRTDVEIAKIRADNNLDTQFMRDMNQWDRESARLAMADSHFWQEQKWDEAQAAHVRLYGKPLSAADEHNYNEAIHARGVIMGLAAKNNWTPEDLRRILSATSDPFGRLNILKTADERAAWQSFAAAKQNFGKWDRSWKGFMDDFQGPVDMGAIEGRDADGRGRPDLDVNLGRRNIVVAPPLASDEQPAQYVPGMTKPVIGQSYTVIKDGKQRQARYMETVFGPRMVPIGAQPASKDAADAKRVKEHQEGPSWWSRYQRAKGGG